MLLPPLSISALQHFQAVALTGSMTKAAAEFGMSVPGVSLQMRRLEELLGFEILKRSGAGVGRHVELTEEGVALAAVVGPLLDELARGLEAIQADRVRRRKTD
jgi:DNA-binding transcriptional LysR family regulator